MAKHGSAEITITLDDQGGTPRIITPYVQELGGMEIEAITVQSNPFGTDAEGHTPVGVSRTPDIAISGFHDDTATVGPHVVLRAIDKTVTAASRTLAVVTGGGTFTVEGLVVKYGVVPSRNNLTGYTSLFRPVALGVWS